MSLWAATSTQAQVIYSQDFNGPGATADSVEWQLAAGLPPTGGDFSAPSVAPTGLAGSGALVCSVKVTDASALSGYFQYSTWTSETLPIGAGPMNLSLTADVTGSRSGARFALIYDDNLGHQIVFHSRIATAGQFQTVGGWLSQADSVDPACIFLPTGIGYSLMVAMEADPAWGSGEQSLKIDNVVLKSVPPVGPFYAENFDKEGASPSSLGWQGGGINAGGDSRTVAITPSGVGGSNALVTSFNVTSPSTFNGWTEFWSGTLKLPAGADAYNLMLTAQVTGSKAGLPFSLKINDHTANKSIYFNGIVGAAGVFQQVGGRLSTANSVSSSFDFACNSGYSILLAFNQSATAWDTGINQLTIDNVVLQSVPRRQIGYLRNFNAPGATPSSEGWGSGGISAGGDTRSVAITPAGVGGSGALVTSVNVTDPGTLSLWTEAWSGSMKLPANSTPDCLFLTAQVTANRAGVPFSLRISDHGSPAAHYITFNGTVAAAGVFQPVGGRLADANSVDPNFNFASTAGYSVMVTMNPSANWGTGTATLTLDEVMIERVVAAASFPVTLAKEPSQAILTWPSNAGQDYAVQFSDSLNNASWFNLASPVRAAGTTTAFTNSTAGVPNRFYRVHAE